MPKNVAKKMVLQIAIPFNILSMFIYVKMANHQMAQ